MRGSPPIPADDLTSLRVSFFLVANKSVDADTITDLTQSLVDVRRDLLSQYPILAQAAAPGMRVVTAPMNVRWQRLVLQPKGSNIS